MVAMSEPARELRQEETAAIPKAAPLLDCCALIVDDEPYVPAALERILRRDFRTIHTALSGAEALEILARERIDLLLTDYRMPGMSGAELCRIVAKEHPGTIRIMLSGQADLDGVIDAINNGSIYKFVTKPWAADVIRPLLREAAEQAMVSRGEVDPVSGWLTRSAFLRHAEQQLAERALGVVCGEFVNSAHLFSISSLDDGRSIYQLLEARCRAALGDGVKLASIGNGVLALLADSSTLPQTLNALSSELQRAITTREGILRPELRLGASTFADHAETLLHQAMVALTAAEDGGRAFACYDPNLRSDLHRRWSLEQDLAGARQNEQLSYVMQPMIDVQTGEVRGAELLMRWDHPLRGAIEPAEFIDLAERTGLICELGQWMIEQGIIECARSVPPEFRVSINVSPRQFADPNFLDVVRGAIADSQVAADRLLLEVTESCVMERFDDAVRILASLRDLGVGVALDDFGTGHSSLAQIRRLPLDVVKIDRAFVSSGGDAKSERLFTSVVKLAKSVGLKVIAEGIESNEHLTLCRRAGVDLAQGFLLGRPVPADEFWSSWN